MLTMMLHSAAVGPLVCGARNPLEILPFPAVTDQFVMWQRKYHSSAIRREERPAYKQSCCLPNSNPRPIFSVRQGDGNTTLSAESSAPST